MLSMVEYVHERMSTYKKREIGADFTMGKGNDTVFLSELCDQVYSFDIQDEALETTRKKLVHDNVKMIKDSHEHLDDYLSSFDIGVFNLGYLPSFSHEITTVLASTEVALKKAIDAMTQVLFVVCYIGHEEGKKEAAWIDEYVSALDHKQYNVSTYRMMNKPLSPYVIEIQKR
jgi:methylase of polypeptide subunit release factors